MPRCYSPSNPARAAMKPLPRQALALAILLAAIVGLLPASHPNTAQAGDLLAFPDGFMVSVKSYGARGDGVTDDTAAVQAALADGRPDPGGDYYGQPKALFFPAGTYLVADTLSWVGCCVTLQGQGAGHTIIKLKDRAPGFGDPTTPKPVVRTMSGNMSFRQNIRDLTVDTGRDNPGAVGIDYIASNSGTIRGVTIRSGDGAGVAGLDLRREWIGPCLFKEIQIEGFDYGIWVKNPEYGPTFEGIALSGQRRAGLRNEGNTLAIRHLTSSNRVPALQSTESRGSLIVLDSTFGGGAPGATAIESDGYLYARNISAAGYDAAIRQKGAVVPGLTQAEYVSDRIFTLFDGPKRSLGLPIEETPALHDNDLASWVAFTTAYYGDTSRLQDVLNAGKATVYFPFGVYFSYDERAVIVPPSVRRIVGFGSVVNRDAAGRNGGGIRLIVQDDSREPLIVEQFGYGIKLDHRGSRPVALKHGGYQYSAAPGAGPLFLEDVEIGDFRMQPGQRVWARQFNNESAGPKIVNTGGALWILGLKTERPGTVIATEAGGRTELLGTLIYPAGAFSPTEQEQAAFVSRDSAMSLIFSTSVYCSECGYQFFVEETRAGVTRRLVAADVPGGRMPLFAGLNPALLCGAPATSPPRGTTTIFLPLQRNGDGPAC